jgi:hypothetical protein
VAPAAATTRSALVSGYGKVPLGFEPNRGQAPAEALFVARASGYTLGLTARGMFVTLPGRDDRASDVLRIQFEGSNSDPDLTGIDELPGKTNYLIGNDPSGWRTGIPNYGGVSYSEVYPGIDVVFYGNRRQLEYDFVVAPGADPRTIRLAIHDFGTNAERIRLDERGRLVLPVPGGEVFFEAPVSYQYFDGARREVPSRFVLLPSSDAAALVGAQAAKVGFEIGAYEGAYGVRHVRTRCRSGSTGSRVG